MPRQGPRTVGAFVLGVCVAAVCVSAHESLFLSYNSCFNTCSSPGATIFWSTNATHLSLALTMNSNVGWLGLGFTSDGTMLNAGDGADFMLAWSDDRDTAHVDDYWSVATSKPTLDTGASSWVLEDMSYDDDQPDQRVFRVSRPLAAETAGQDATIDPTVEQYLTWAISPDMPLSTKQFSRHTVAGATHLVPEQRFDCLAQVCDNDAQQLSQAYAAHAILNLLAWGAMIPMAILIARFSKKENSMWLPHHVALVSLAMFLSGVAVYTMLQEHGFSTLFTTVHSGAGCVVVLASLVQVLLGILSHVLYDPERKSAPLLDQLHWWLGRGTFLTACVAMVTGAEAINVRPLLLTAILFAALASIVVVALNLTFTVQSGGASDATAASPSSAAASVAAVKTAGKSALAQHTVQPSTRTGITNQFLGYGAVSLVLFAAFSASLLAPMTPIPADPGFNYCLEGDCDEFVIALDNIDIPVNETSYLCKEFVLPVDKKRHIVGFEPMIRSERYDHHIVLWQQLDDLPDVYEVDENGIFHCERMAADVTMAWAWAVGGKPMPMPEHVGMPMSDQDGDLQRVILQIHLDNPAGVVGEKTNTGVKLHATPTLRQDEAGMFWVQGWWDHLTFPPGQANQLIEMETRPDMFGTQGALTEGPITVFSVFLHAHQTGRAIWLSRATGPGQPFEPLASMNPFSFDDQQGVSTEYTVHPGDIMKIIGEFDTTGRTEVTTGGTGSRNEMLDAFQLYYPRSKSMPVLIPAFKTSP